MGILTIKVKALPVVNWGSATMQFIRNVSESKPANISYTSGSGQSLTVNQVVFEEGTVNTAGYLKVVSANATTLTTSGTVSFVVTHQPSASASNTSKTFSLFNGNATLNMQYNSNPTANDIEIEILNRATYIFSFADFYTKYLDYDSDALVEIQINGDVTGFEIDGIPYVAGTWIPISQISNGLLEYVPLDQDAEYEKIISWKAKDINGNISIT